MHPRCHQHHPHLSIVSVGSAGNACLHYHQHRRRQNLPFQKHHLGRHHLHREHHPHRYQQRFEPTVQRRQLHCCLVACISHLCKASVTHVQTQLTIRGLSEDLPLLTITPSIEFSKLFSVILKEEGKATQL